MLIRTQDKDILVNPDNIFAIAVSDYGMIRAIKSPDDNYAANLGTYSSKEKALKVLDIIAKAYYEAYHNTIFDMPQDDEVET